jgi:hypothetical protein
VKDVGHSAAARKAWASRRGAGGHKGSLLSQAKKSGAIVRPYFSGLRVSRKGRASSSVREERGNRYARQRRIGNVNAIRIQRGKMALVFKNQGMRLPRRSVTLMK